MVHHPQPHAYAFSLAGLFLLLTWVAATAVMSRMVGVAATAIILGLPLPGLGYVMVVRAWTWRRRTTDDPPPILEGWALGAGFLIINLLSLTVVTALLLLVAGHR